MVAVCPSQILELLTVIVGVGLIVAVTELENTLNGFAQELLEVSIQATMAPFGNVLDAKDEELFPTLTPFTNH